MRFSRPIGLVLVLSLLGDAVAPALAATVPAAPGTAIAGAGGDDAPS